MPHRIYALSSASESIQSFKHALKALTAVYLPQKCSALLCFYNRDPVYKSSKLMLCCHRFHVENNHRALTTEQQTIACCLSAFFEEMCTKRTLTRFSHTVNPAYETLPESEKEIGWWNHALPCCEKAPKIKGVLCLPPARLKAAA